MVIQTVIEPDDRQRQHHCDQRSDVRDEIQEHAQQSKHSCQPHTETIQRHCDQSTSKGRQCCLQYHVKLDLGLDFLKEGETLRVLVHFFFNRCHACEKHVQTQKKRQDQVVYEINEGCRLCKNVCRRVLCYDCFAAFRKRDSSDRFREGCERNFHPEQGLQMPVRTHFITASSAISIVWLAVIATNCFSKGRQQISSPAEGDVSASHF